MLKTNRKKSAPGLSPGRKKSSAAGQIRFLVGIDEAGRGPLAGPVSVGAVVVPFRENSAINAAKNARAAKRASVHPILHGVKDSKSLSAMAREEWFGRIKEASVAGTLGFSVSCVSAKIIDRRGIVFAVRTAIRRCLNKLGVPPHETQILLDGSLYAPEHFIFQETIIRGDQTVPIISLASIAAKVVRDRKMIRLAREFPEFGFEIHKGYGTLRHRQKIRKLGPCEIHRSSYLSNLF